MPGPEDSFVIVGAGQAGVQIADSLRQEGHKGPVTLIGEEHYPPYQRPPLSKDYLAGSVVESQLYLRSPEMLAKKDISFVAGARVVAVDLAARKVALSDGRAFACDRLALATGCRARPLPVEGASLAGVLLLRGIDDTKRIAESLSVASKVAVIGGGFIGLEIAATARSVGKDVTVLEGADRLMARAVSPVISEHFLNIHRARGVHIELGAKVIGLTGKGGHVASVETADGKSSPADVVVIGIGIIPNDDLGKSLGIACDNGIIVDACSRTSNPNVVAAGDCTARRMEDGRLLRLESVQNAVEQGKSAAAALTGRERPFIAAPWFWSDQYDEKLQMAGLSVGYDQIVIRGAQEQNNFSAFYFREGRLLGSDSVNQPKDHMATRRMLDKKVNPTPEQTADAGFNFQTLLK